MSDDSKVDSSGLTPEDYDRYFMLNTRWLVGAFCLILVITSALFYWFSASMRANSDKRVREATYIINRADTAPREISPRTLELEEMKVNTEKERDWLMSKLAADSYAKRLNEKLKSKFQRNSFYIELPDNWKEQISPELREWYKKRRKQRFSQLNRLYQELPNFIERNLDRLDRLEKIRTELDLGDTFSPTIKRYQATRRNFKDALQDLRESLKEVSASRPEKPRVFPAVYRAMLQLPDLMNRMSLQYRRFSSLTSAPSAYIYAEQFLHDALRIDPKNPEAYYQLGRVYDKLGLSVISSEHYIWAIKEARDYHRAPEIIEMFKKELEQNPQSSRAHYNLAFAYHELGRKKKAKPLLREVLKLEKGESSMVRVLARKRLDYIEHGVSIYNKLTYH